MDRGYLGTTPLGTERDDDSYLDFVEGMRSFTLTKVASAARPMAERALAEEEARTGVPVKGLEAIRPVLDNVPAIATNKRLMRSVQEMMWNGVIETYRKREPELLAELDRTDKIGPGSVEWDPNYRYPDYFSAVDFHIQPGGYYADPLTGHIYQYGTKVFYTGRNNNDDVQRELAWTIPTPADGQVRRVLEIACGSGQGTTALKERWPEAEVWGTDISGPFVRYAHKRAVEMNLDVHFRQEPAEESRFPDNSFDVVMSYLLFHEIPTYITDRVVAEVHRILRPGGVFAIFDFPNRPKGEASPVTEYMRQFDTEDNGEPYASEFVWYDFHGLLRRTFREVNDKFAPQLWIPSRTAIK